MATLLLRAKALARDADNDHHKSTLQVYEEWDQTSNTWKDWAGNNYYRKIEGKIGTDDDQPPYEFPQGTPPLDSSFEKILQGPQYNEIQLQPLVMIDESKEQIKDLVDKGITATALYRSVWSKMKWKSDTTKSLTWTFDTKLYTTFEEGVWADMDDNPNFTASGKTTDISGLCLVYLTLRTKTDEMFPRNLDFTSLRCSTLDGVHRESSLRGAILNLTKFVGNSRLNASDLTSTLCWGAQLRFDEKSKNLEVWPSLENAGFVVDAAFKVMGASTTSSTTTQSQQTGLCNCCKRREPANYTDIHFVKKFWFVLFKSRTEFLKHQNEIHYVVEELERLRRYEVNGDNWHEIIDSWDALFQMTMDTKQASALRAKLFKEADSQQITNIGDLLYCVEDNPPQGLLLKIKKHVKNSLLGNKEYIQDKKMLTDETVNIDEIIRLKDTFDGFVSNLVLAILFFGSNVLSDLVRPYLYYALDEIMAYVQGQDLS